MASFEASRADIASTLAGKNVFITGGMGFIGKCFIEKMLRSVPRSGKIFLLIRGKKNMTAQERLEKMLEEPVSG